ncbi:hypothetical protein [Xanthobacter flavus]|uniref:hypothetical protein n=1 Tax=Xanthobacter flavus TaxID=281 RepID=UPI001AE96391|nr:hypothetical protein [Xanthobacter flavus]MBP2150102.1 hypothetical protein [Xanthobacter flavus]
MSTTARQRRIDKAVRAKAAQLIATALKDMPVRSLLEGDDDYGFVTAILGPRHRVILAKGGSSWLVQRRDIAVGTVSRRAWRKLSAHPTRDELLVAVAGLGLTIDPTVMETLLDLPEWASMAPSLFSEVGLHSTPGADTDTGPSTLSELMARRRGRFVPFGAPAPGGNKETEDLYRKGVCRLNDGWRVILTKDRAQFALQRREGKTPDGFPRWTSRSFCKSKAVLLRDVTRFAGKVDPMARLVLDALPSEADHVYLRA